MAATYGRLTGDVAVALSTLGPGATNLVTAAAYAQLGGMPMVMVTGQQPIKTSKQGQFQILDVVDMMAPLTKYTRQLASGDSVPARVREAFRIAQEEKPGAAHLELPEDIAGEDTTTEVIRPSLSRRPVVETKAIHAAVDLIEGARRPILLVGAGANRKMTCKMLRAFVDRFEIAFVTTQMGKGVLEKAHLPRHRGGRPHRQRRPRHRREATVLHATRGHRGGARQLSSAQVDTVYFPQVEVVGDIANAIWQIGERLTAQAHWDFERILAIKKAGDAHLLEGSTDDRFPMYPQRLVADVRAAVEGEGMITVDNGVYKIWFARNYRATASNSVLLDNDLATMGAGLPSAIAAKLVHPDRP